VLAHLPQDYVEFERIWAGIVFIVQ
jgi:hypothetical protein